MTTHRSRAGRSNHRFVSIALAVTIIGFGLALSPAEAADGDLVWARQLGGAGTDQGNGVAVDADGNVYTTGYFQGVADFDPGVGTFNMTSAGGDDVFVSKLDAAGSFVWARQLGGTSDDKGIGAALDASGNVYITGSFQATADFDPGAGTFNLVSAGGFEVFVTKLDAGGSLVWARQLGGASTDFSEDIAVDPAGSVYTTGRFFGVAADFDPGVGTFNMTPVAGGLDAFVSKLDTAGNFVWARQLGGAGDDSGLGIAVDGVGTVYTSGTFNAIADFDPGVGTFNMTPAGGLDVFVSKLDAAGNFVWARQLGGASDDEGFSVAVDSVGNVHTAGYFISTADFDPGLGTFNLASVGGRDAFVSKLDAAGNFVWARQLGSASDDEAFGVAVDAAGTVYTTGGFKDTADLDPGAGTFNLVSAGGLDVFISELAATGAFASAHQLGGTNPEVGRGIAVDAGGAVHTTGQFLGTTDFDPGVGTLNLTSSATDAFVSKLAGPIGYVSVVPGRLMDTRIPASPTVDGQFEAIGVRSADSTTELQVTGRAGVPADAEAVVLNVTVTGATGGGFVTVYPCGAALPNASNLNFVAGDTIPNLVITQIGAGGNVCLFTSAGTHLIVDLNGFYPAGSVYTPLVPGRLLDSRQPASPTVDGLFQAIGVRAAGSTLELQVTGRHGVPADAASVVLNVTATGASGGGFVTIYPCGAALPNASNLNFVAGDTIPNLVITQVGVGGKVCLFTSADTHLIADVDGHFPASVIFNPLVPGRLLDTRAGGTTVDGLFQAIGIRSAGTTTELQVTGRHGVPVGADTAVLNITVTGPTGGGFITVYPCGAALPNASNLNFVAGENIPNLVITQIGAGGKVCLFTSADTHLIADVSGFYPT